MLQGEPWSIAQHETRNMDLADLEQELRRSRGWRRGDFCKALGISQAKLRRQIDLGPSGRVPRTMALAMAALAVGLEPFVNGRLSGKEGGAPRKSRDGDQESSREAPRG